MSDEGVVAAPEAPEPSTLDSFAPDVDLKAEMGKEPEAAPAPEPEKKREDKYVPIQALDEARGKEREARARAETMEKESAERFARLEKRLELMANPPPPIPDYNENPAEYLRLRQEGFETDARQRFADQDKVATEQAETHRVRELTDRITRDVASAESEYVKQNPDYMDAVAFMRDIQDRNLQEIGINDPQERASIIHKQTMDMAYNAFQNGRNPAEIAHKFAKNYGFVVKGNIEKQIANISRGQEATSLGTGGKADTQLSLKSLEAMSDDEFDAVLDDKSWKKLMRG